MTDDRLRALVEAKIAEWRKEADAHYRYGDMRDDPYDDVAHEHKEKARVKRRYADEIESLLASGGSPEPGWQPIESMPRHGGAVLAASKFLGIPVVERVWWDSGSGRWEGAQGEQRFDAWMPLPPAPVVTPAHQPEDEEPHARGDK